MDATPIRLGQEFSGYAQQVGYGKERGQKSVEVLREIAFGGTAVKTGRNRHIDLPKKMPRHLEQPTVIAFTRRKIISKRNAERTQLVEASGHLKTIAVSLFKIANDHSLGSGAVRAAAPAKFNFPRPNRQRRQDQHRARHCP